MTTWWFIGSIAVVTAVIKGIGPFVLGGRDLGARFGGVIALMAPALLAALVVTATFTDGNNWRVGAVTVGVGVGGIAAWRGASAIVSVIVAMACTALLRADYAALLRADYAALLRADCTALLRALGLS